MHSILFLTINNFKGILIIFLNTYGKISSLKKSNYK